MFPQWSKLFDDTHLDYLRVPSVHAECPQHQVLGIQHATSMLVAQAKCDARAQCSFFDWDAEKSIATLCSNNKPEMKESLINTVGIKPTAFQLPGYRTLMNYQAVCKPPDVLPQSSTDQSYHEGFAQCNADKHCHYFTVVSSPNGMGKLYRLCGGEPTLMYKPGWLIAGKIQFMPPLRPLEVFAMLTHGFPAEMRQASCALLNYGLLLESPEPRSANIGSLCWLARQLQALWFLSAGRMPEDLIQQERCSIIDADEEELAFTGIKELSINGLRHLAQLVGSLRNLWAA